MMSAFLKRPQALDVAVRGVRGLAAPTYTAHPIAAAALRIFADPIAESNEIELKPGEEVTVRVTLPFHIPADAEFVHLLPALLPQTDGSPAVQLAQTSTVTEQGDSPKKYTVDISSPVTAMVLSIRLEEGDVFWTFNNSLTENRYNMPDIAEHANRYLDGIQQTVGAIDVPIELPFVIKSSRGGKVKIGIFAIDYVRVKTESWFNELDGTERVDRNFSISFAQVETIPLESLDDDTGVKLQEIHLDVGGAFGPERILGTIMEHDGREMITISGDYAIAQGIFLNTAIQCVGVSAFLGSEAGTELYVEILADTTEMPGSSDPLAQTTTHLPVEPTQSAANWKFIPFETSVDLRPDKKYWIVFKGVQGVSRLAMQAQTNTYLSETLVNRGGQLWRPLHSGQVAVLPLLRCVYLPEIDNQTAAITLRVESTDIRRPIDPQPDSQHVIIQPAEAIDAPTVLIIESQAQGTLSLANLIQKFQPSS